MTKNNKLSQANRWGRCLCAFVWLSIALLGSSTIGCQKGAGQEEEAHHIPAHLPANFEQALARIEQLVAHLKDGAVLEQKPTEVTVETELRDVVRWLPELAAQSDLKEADWNVVDEATRDLIDSFSQAKEPPEKWMVQGETLAKIAQLPQQLAAVREKYRAMQVPDVVEEAESEDQP